MSDLRKKILNGFMNVILIGLPIALVLMFGEKFSLWINLLTLGCVLVVSVSLSMIGDEGEYESSKRILISVIGASIAACLKVLEYPGHTTMVIMGTILIISTFDLIDRGQIIWLEFTRRSRLRFLGKFILLITFLGNIGLVVANFGSQAIWIPIVTALLLLTLLFNHDAFLQNDSSEKEKTFFISAGALILTGVISTFVQFWTTELFLGIKLWQLLAGLAILIILIAALVFIWIIRQSRIERLENQEKESVEREKQRKTEAEKKAKEEEALAKRQAEVDTIMAKNIENWSVNDFVIICNLDVQTATKAFLKSSINGGYIASLITISVYKEQIVWGHGLSTFLQILELIAQKSYSDEELGRITTITLTLRRKVTDLKGSDDAFYKGEKELLNMITRIEEFAKKND
jgi:hypothetical protein